MQDRSHVWGDSRIANWLDRACFPGATSPPKKTAPKEGTQSCQRVRSLYSGVSCFYFVSTFACVPSVALPCWNPGSQGTFWRTFGSDPGISNSRAVDRRVDTGAMARKQSASQGLLEISRVLSNKAEHVQIYTHLLIHFIPSYTILYHLILTLQTCVIWLYICDNI